MAKGQLEEFDGSAGIYPNPHLSHELQKLLRMAVDLFFFGNPKKETQWVDIPWDFSPRFCRIPLTASVKFKVPSLSVST